MRNPQWKREGRRDIAAQIKGIFKWISAEPYQKQGGKWLRSAGRSCQRSAPKIYKNKLERKAQKKAQVKLLKTLGGRHVPHRVHLAKAA